MTVIELPDRQAAALAAKAAAQGLSLKAWLAKLAEEDAPEGEQDEKAKLEDLRAAARIGFDAIERGEYITLTSDDDVSAFMRQLHEEATRELAAQKIA